ncbi:MAG: hypothetical protein PHW69_04140 [Elusimicrobiaceae bacterium]|nr:hypothetical protein [Elusimicrobiaceae bacterium]
MTGKCFFRLLLLASLSAPAAFCAAKSPVQADNFDGISWHTLSSSHYDVYYEANWPPSGIVLDLERIYSKLRMNLSSFAAFRDNDKIKVYIYKSKKSFLSSDRNPPAWAQALAIYGGAERTILIYDMKDPAKLRNTIAHESTHIILHHYFEKNKRQLPIPDWFNEGMATLVEDSVSDGEAWSSSLEYFKASKFMPPDQMLYSKAGTDTSSEAASLWYMEAFSMVKFLNQPDKKFQFAELAAALREQTPVETALRTSYRYRNMAEFEEAWHEWINAFKKKNAAGGNTFSSSEFKPFRTDFDGFSQNSKPAFHAPGGN